jgi:hypothetical protein
MGFPMKGNQYNRQRRGKVMARIRIVDLPRNAKVSKEEMKRIRGGLFDVFMKLEYYTGESRDSTHKSEIDLLGLSPLR